MSEISAKWPAIKAALDDFQVIKNNMLENASQVDDARNELHNAGFSGDTADGHQNAMVVLDNRGDKYRDSLNRLQTAIDEATQQLQQADIDGGKSFG